VSVISREKFAVADGNFFKIGMAIVCPENDSPKYIQRELFYQGIGQQGWGTVIYYHAQIFLKDPKADDLFEFDLPEEYIRDKIAKPFVAGLPFFFGGASIRTENVERLRVVRTDEPADAVSSRMAQAYRRNRVMVSKNMAKEWIVSKNQESVDVTRDFLNAAGSTVNRDRESQSSPGKAIVGTIFIVHGHDQNLLKDLELALRRWGLDPIVLSQKANRGQTLVEKFEANANVGFAFVLLTPDDVGGKESAHLQPRARQNVIWEWGYLIGRLGRNRVCCVYREGVEMPSDLHGIVTVNVRTGLDEKLEEIRRELKEAGFPVP
jgi:predicted nucleotide-binding protein